MPARANGGASAKVQVVSQGGRIQASHRSLDELSALRRQLTQLAVGGGAGGRTPEGGGGGGGAAGQSLSHGGVGGSLNPRPEARVGACERVGSDRRGEDGGFDWPPGQDPRWGPRFCELTGGGKMDAGVAAEVMRAEMLALTGERDDTNEDVRAALERVWELSDTDQDGMLTSDEVG